MSLSFPTVVVIGSAPERIDLLKQNGSQLTILDYANRAASRCPKNADIIFVDPATCDHKELIETLQDPHVKCVIVLLTKAALEDEKVLALARAAIEGTKGRYICHIVHYYRDQTVIYNQLPTNGCTMLPNTVGNSLNNLFLRMAEYGLSGR